MKKINIIWILAAAFLFLSAPLFAQSIDIERVIVDDYPEITVEFFVRDADGKAVMANPAEMSLIENGVNIAFRDMICYENVTRFSVVLTIDQSKSMDENNRIGSVKAAARNFVKSLPEGRFECAVTGFWNGWDGNQIHYPYANDKDKLDSAIAEIITKGGTDFNMAFIGNPQNPGCLPFARDNAQWKNVIIFLTDGEHDVEQGEFKHNDVDDMIINELDAILYVIALEVENWRGKEALNNLIATAINSGGGYFTDITTDDIRDIYYQILRSIDDVGDPVPCSLKFDATCESGGTLELSTTAFGGLSQTIDYQIPANVKPYVQSGAATVAFKNVQSGASGEIPVQVFARNNFLDISSYSSTNPAFSVSDWGGTPPTFRLERDQSRTIKIKYTPTDSMCNESNITFPGTACDGVIRAKAGMIFARDVDMGTAIKDQEKTLTYDQVFCNWTCDAVTVDKIEIAGGQAAEFDIKTQITPFELAPGECKPIEFGFTPAEKGERSSNIEVSLSGGEKYTSRIFGVASGSAAIDASAVDFGNVDCSSPEATRTLTIRNDGALDLEITQMTFENSTGEVEFTNGNPVPPDMIVTAGGGTRDVELTFNPAAAGSYNPTLKIVSNAENAPDFSVQLSGERDSVYFKPEQNEVDFGEVCAGETAELELRLENSGSVPIDVSASGVSRFGVDNTNLTIDPGFETITINVSGSANEEIEENLVLSGPCNIEHIVNLKAKIVSPELESSVDPVTLSATLGSSAPLNVKIYNRSNAELNIVSASPQDAQFEVVSPTFPQTVAAGDFVECLIRYSPSNETPIDTELIFSVEQCDYEYSLPLEGRPSTATVDIEIDDHEAFAGEIIDVPVHLRDKQKFVESQVSLMSATIAFDETILQAQPPTPAGYVQGGLRIIEYKNISVGGVGDEVFETMRLLVLISENTQTALEILDAKAEDGEISVNKDPGLFDLKKASAKIYLKDVSAKPGQNFDLNIYISDAQGLSSFHESIAATLEMESTLIEILPPTDAGTIDAQGIRTIEIDNIPIPQSAAETIAYTIKCRAMLGRVPKTDLTILSVETAKGVADFEADGAEFALLEVCESGGVERLFDPYAKAGIISVSPNPANESCEIEFATVESGATRIYISNIVGSNAIKILEENYSPGRRSLTFDASGLSSGSYYVIMETPTQKFAKRLDIVK